MKKKLLFFALLLCAASFCFAERRTRVYTYKNFTVKLVWDDNYVNAPPDKNWAQEWYDDAIASWESVTKYRYGLNYWYGECPAASVNLYKSGGGLLYRVVENHSRDDIWETVYEQDFYTYNDAYNVFKKIANRFEGLIN